MDAVFGRQETCILVLIVLSAKRVHHWHAGADAPPLAARRNP